MAAYCNLCRAPSNARDSIAATAKGALDGAGIAGEAAAAATASWNPDGGDESYKAAFGESCSSSYRACSAFVGVEMHTRLRMRSKGESGVGERSARAEAAAAALTSTMTLMAAKVAPTRGVVTVDDCKLGACDTLVEEGRLV